MEERICERDEFQVWSERYINVRTLSAARFVEVSENWRFSILLIWPWNIVITTTLRYICSIKSVQKSQDLKLSSRHSRTITVNMETGMQLSRAVVEVGRVWRYSSGSHWVTEGYKPDNGTWLYAVQLLEERYLIILCSVWRRLPDSTQSSILTGAIYVRSFIDSVACILVPHSNSRWELNDVAV